MKNSINELYISWLIQYQSLNKDCNVNALILKINASAQIEALAKLFSSYLDPKLAPYGAISLYSQLSSWKLALEKTMVNHKQAITALNKVAVTTRNKKLIMLLQEVLSEPKLLLHVQVPSLLQTLCANSLTELIDYIVHLPKVAPLLNPRPGSFAAQVPLSPQHAACLALLNNLPATINDKSSLWNTAQSLLHSSLLLYKELELIEISLDDEQTSEESIEEKPENKNSCILM